MNQNINFDELGIPDALQGDARLSTLAFLEDKLASINFPAQIPLVMVEDFGRFRTELARAKLEPGYD